MKWYWWALIGATLLFRKSSRSNNGMVVSKNFNLEEFVKPADLEAGLNYPILNNIQGLIDNVLQPARTRLGIPIRVHSAYRNPTFNASIGGVPNSQHVHGMAADISPVPATLENFKKLWDELIKQDYDQIIWENAKAFSQKPSHIHVSRVSVPSSKYTYNRGKKLQLYKGRYSYI